MNRILPLALMGTLLASTAWAASPAPSSSAAPVQVAQAMAATTTATPAKAKPRSAKWVKEAQTQLKAAGYDPGKIDGVPGKQTRTAVKAFQTAKGLKVTGRLDTATRKALKG